MCPRLSELKQTKLEFGDYGRAMQGEWVACAQKKPQTPHRVSAKQF